MSCQVSHRNKHDAIIKHEVIFKHDTILNLPIDRGIQGGSDKGETVDDVDVRVFYYFPPLGVLTQHHAVQYHQFET